MRRLLLFFSFLLPLILWQQIAVAQESNSFYKSINIDFSYGYPYYIGDFSSISGAPQPYLNQPITAYQLYNLSSLSGSVALHLFSRFSMRLRVTHSTVFYTSPAAFVNFKNSSVDFSLIPQVNFEFGRVLTYLYLGGGYNILSDATVWDTQLELETESNNKRTWGISSTAGFGINYNVYKNIAIFIEGDIMLTGSDDFDGFKGTDFNSPDGEALKPKKYLSRDMLATGRAGIRISFNSKAKPVGERKVLEPISSYYENPDEELNEEAARKDSSIIPEEWVALGVVDKLKGVTLQVHKALTIEELKIQKSTAEKVLGEIKLHYPTANIQLLWEPIGVSVHFGGFKSHADIKSARLLIRRFYSDALVRRK